MIHIDGSLGEGGGQVLRTSLSLACVTGQAFHIEKIRAKRGKPGLLRQHLCGVRAAATLTGADVEGDALGSTSLTFRPGRVRGGTHTFAVGSAGSAGLVLQTVLWPLLAADGPSDITLEGGTHNPAAPPADFLLQAFLPLIQRMGAKVELSLRGHGFAPAGGGRYHLVVQPGPLGALELLHRGEVRWSVRALSSNLPKHVAQRESDAAATLLGTTDARPQAVRSDGPGNAVVVVGASDTVTEVFTGFGEKRKTAERVATEVAHEALAWEASGVPVGEHLADQLLIPLALAGAGRFRTVAPSLHTRTNAVVIERFTGKRLRFEPDGATVVATL